MTQWLQILTNVDLGDRETASKCTTIDGLLDWLETGKGLNVTHSTGTMGCLSFSPWAKTEAEAGFSLGMQGFAKWWTDIGTKFHIVWMGASGSRSGLLSCKEGRFHAPEWLDVRVLDPANNWELLPCTGTQEGRGAFFDHSVTSCPRGLVSSGHIVISYDPCKCGRTTPHLSPDIKRLQDSDYDYSFVPAPRDEFGAMLGLLRAAN